MFPLQSYMLDLHLASYVLLAHQSRWLHAPLNSGFVGSDSLMKDRSLVRCVLSAPPKRPGYPHSSAWSLSWAIQQCRIAMGSCSHFLEHERRACTVLRRMMVSPTGHSQHGNGGHSEVSFHMQSGVGLPTQSSDHVSCCLPVTRLATARSRDSSVEQTLPQARG